MHEADLERFEVRYNVYAIRSAFRDCSLPTHVTTGGRGALRRQRPVAGASRPGGERACIRCPADPLWGCAEARQESIAGRALNHTLQRTEGRGARCSSVAQSIEAIALRGIL